MNIKWLNFVKFLPNQCWQREGWEGDMYRTCNQSQYTRADKMCDYDRDFIGCGLPLSNDQLLFTGAA